MSMNKYMHPRNIYINPPDFKELAIKYPEFRENVKQDITGKVSIDFKNVNSLRALSRALLLKDFDLNVEIPSNKLIPTIPLRLNYLLWIEDLLSIKDDNNKSIYGIDIGTGASCVYPLMAAKKFQWNMIGTEIDKESLKCAKRNICSNLLNDKVEVYEVTKNVLLKEVLQNKDKVFDFCMCNPPFFSSIQELHPFFKSRKSSRPHPKNAFCASVDEVVVSGGEVEFITTLIKESAELREKVRIFTTMIGHKSSLVPLKAILRKSEVCSFKQTEFCQGRTTRWGLAWTFLDIDLRTIPLRLRSSKFKAKPPLNFVVHNSDNETYTVEKINVLILNIIEELKLQIKEHKKNKGSIIYEILATSNTWSNQRRKKRKKLKQLQSESHDITSTSLDETNETLMKSPQKDKHFGSSLHFTENLELNSSSLNEEIVEIQCTSEKLAEMDITSAPNTPKRVNEDEDEYYNNKKFKTNNTTDNNNYFAKFCIAIREQKLGIILELFSVDSNTNRETIHQILQYIKNKLK